MDPVVLFDMDSIHTRRSSSVLAEDAAPVSDAGKRPDDKSGAANAGWHPRFVCEG
jgi:hypothetical protein